jgi:hypothetical protein
LLNDRPGLAIPADDTAESAFKEMFESLIEKEFEHRGVPADDAATIMWREHQQRFGPGCNNCFVHLGDLAQVVPNGRTMFGSGNSNNLLSCFVPRFFPLVAQEYPSESGRNLAIRLVRMWNKHVFATSVASLMEFQMPCTVPNCRCLEHWDYLFNRGDCQKSSFATNICGEVEAMNDFRTKYYVLVEAEFAITEFPDATNFALGRMWRQHLIDYEETCGSACRCWKELSTLAQGVLAEMLRRRDAMGWTNCRGFTADSVPTGALLCYSRHSLGRFVQDKLFAAKQELAVNACLMKWPARTGEKCGSACQCTMPTTANNDVIVVDPPCTDAVEDKLDDADDGDNLNEDGHVESADEKDNVDPDVIHCELSFDCSKTLGVYVITESLPGCRPSCKIISGTLNVSLSTTGSYAFQSTQGRIMRTFYNMVGSRQKPGSQRTGQYFPLPIIAILRVRSHKV